MKKLFLVAFSSIIVISACKTGKETAKTEAVVVRPPLDCSTSGVNYESIKGIIEKNCTSCHGYGGADGLNFLTVADVRKAATKGELLGTIKHQRGFPRMPANTDQLSQADIDLIECWINNGMKD